MMIAINSSIILYAQLAIVAENRPKQTIPSFSAGAVLFKDQTKKVAFFSRNAEFTLRSQPSSKIYCSGGSCRGWPDEMFSGNHCDLHCSQNTPRSDLRVSFHHRTHQDPYSMHCNSATETVCNRAHGIIFSSDGRT